MGWRPFLWLFLLQLGLHLPHLFKPASGNHVWRQCNSLALAKNFADESMDIRYPRIDKRYGSDGICGPSFVAYEYGLAVLYKVFGFHETLFRAWSFSLCLAVMLGWFVFLTRFFPRDYALLGAASLFGFPEFYFHSIGKIERPKAIIFSTDYIILDIDHCGACGIFDLYNSVHGIVVTALIVKCCRHTCCGHSECHGAFISTVIGYACVKNC